MTAGKRGNFTVNLTHRELDQEMVSQTTFKAFQNIVFFSSSEYFNSLN